MCRQNTSRVAMDPNDDELSYQRQGWRRKVFLDEPRKTKGPDGPLLHLISAAAGGEAAEPSLVDAIAMFLGEKVTIVVALRRKGGVERSRERSRNRVSQYSLCDYAARDMQA